MTLIEMRKSRNAQEAEATQLFRPFGVSEAEFLHNWSVDDPDWFADWTLLCEAIELKVQKDARCPEICARSHG